jgi:hypothetical protein
MIATLRVSKDWYTATVLRSRLLLFDKAAYFADHRIVRIKLLGLPQVLPSLLLFAQFPQAIRQPGTVAGVVGLRDDEVLKLAFRLGEFTDLQQHHDQIVACLIIAGVQLHGPPQVLLGSAEISQGYLRHGHVAVAAGAAGKVAERLLELLECLGRVLHTHQGGPQPRVRVIGHSVRREVGVTQLIQGLLGELRGLRIILS